MCTNTYCAFRFRSRSRSRPQKFRREKVSSWKSFVVKKFRKSIFDLDLDLKNLLPTPPGDPLFHPVSFYLLLPFLQNPLLDMFFIIFWLNIFDKSFDNFFQSQSQSQSRSRSQNRFPFSISSRLSSRFQSQNFSPTLFSIFISTFISISISKTSHLLPPVTHFFTLFLFTYFYRFSKSSSRHVFHHFLTFNFVKKFQKKVFFHRFCSSLWRFSMFRPRFSRVQIPLQSPTFLT